jgi:hypothetical protein
MHSGYKLAIRGGNNAAGVGSVVRGKMLSYLRIPLFIQFYVTTLLNAKRKKEKEAIM